MKFEQNRFLQYNWANILFREMQSIFLVSKLLCIISQWSAVRVVTQRTKRVSDADFYVYTSRTENVLW